MTASPIKATRPGAGVCSGDGTMLQVGGGVGVGLRSGADMVSISPKAWVES